VQDDIVCGLRAALIAYTGRAGQRPASGHAFRHRIGALQEDAAVEQRIRVFETEWRIDIVRATTQRETEAGRVASRISHLIDFDHLEVVLAVASRGEVQSSFVPLLALLSQLTQAWMSRFPSPFVSRQLTATFWMLENTSAALLMSPHVSVGTLVSRLSHGGLGALERLLIEH
jgi:hypothetical protein